jgi:hypothetical protein
MQNVTCNMNSPTLHNPPLLLRQPIQIINQLVDLFLMIGRGKI